MKKFIVDANIFLRLFIPEDKELSSKASEFLKKAKDGKISLLVPQIIIFEVNYSLQKYYHFEKESIIEALSSIVSASYFNVESREMFMEALKIYENNNIDFTDCFLAARKKMEDVELFTFDKKLQKYAKNY